jgi:hypothetical protein
MFLSTMSIFIMHPVWHILGQGQMLSRKKDGNGLDKFCTMVQFNSVCCA